MKNRPYMPNALTVALCSLCFALLLSSCSDKNVKKNEPFEPEKYLSDADKLTSGNEFEEARKLLLEVKNRDTSKKYTPLAQLRIAETYIKEGENDLAVEEYRKFLEFYPDNQYASYAQYQIAMAYFSQIGSPDRGSGEAEKALKEFRRLKELYPRNPYREVIDLRIEKCLAVMADGELLVAQFYFKKESYNAAAARIEGLFKKFPEYKRGDEALLVLYKSYKRLKMKDKAKEAYDRLMAKYPSSASAASAKKDARD